VRFAVLVVFVVSTLAVAPFDAGARSIMVRFAPFDVEPESDRITCQYLSLGNRVGTDVERLTIRAPRTGFHHVNLFAYLGTDRDPGLITDGVVDQLGCFGVGPPDFAARSGGLLGAVREGTYDLPAGYAVTIGPEQPVRIITHVFNRTSRVRRAAVRLKIVPTAAKAVAHHLEAFGAVLFDIDLPPRTTTAHAADFVAPFPMNVVMLSSHQHRFGSHATIRPIVGGADLGQVYENFRWAEPPLTWLDQPLHLEAGDRLRLRCEWKNESDVTLHYGDSAKDEMCNLNGYFFRDAEIPAEARTGIAGVLLPVVE
jgi:hypothetical protein